MSSPARVAVPVSAPGRAAATAARPLVLIAVLLGVFLSVLDQTIVAAALPTMARELGGGDLYTWVTTAYLLAATVAIPVYGKLSDAHGRRPLFLAGIALFATGSVLAGLAPTMPVLVAARAVQGLGAGAFFPLALAVIGDLYPPADRARPQALFGLLFAIAAIIGPVAGGVLADGPGWPWIFFVNIPIGAIAAAIAVRAMPPGGPATVATPFDAAGAIALAATAILALVGLTGAQRGDWASPSVVLPLAAALPLGVLFVLAERRAADPILPPSLFAIGAFTGAVAASFLVSAAFLAAVVFLPLWLQLAQGATAIESGIRSLALLGGLVIGALGGARAVARTGRARGLLVGSALLAAAGFALLTQLGPSTPAPLVAAWMLVAGLGLGPLYSVLTVVAQAAAPASAMGVASGALTFARQIGGALGLAVLGTAFALGSGGVVAAEAAMPGVVAVAEAVSRGAAWSFAGAGIATLLAGLVLARAPDVELTGTRGGTAR